MELVIGTKKHGDKNVYFDDEDWPLLQKYTWHLTYNGGIFYCRCHYKINGKFVSKKMHRIIMGLQDKVKPIIDHKDNNGLNNRRSNLRIATYGQNRSNTGPNKTNTTGYKGVYLYKEPNPMAGLYTAAIRTEGNKKCFGGYFKTAEEAAKRYNELAIERYGEFAYLNQIPK